MRKMNKTMFRLCAKSLSGELGAEENKHFKEWLAASEDNQRMYNELKEVWIHSKPPIISDIPDIDTEWLNFTTELQLKSNKNGNIKNNSFKNILIHAGTFFSRKNALIVYAAAVLFIIVGFLLWERYFTSTSFNVTTSRGEKTLITLSDDTKVHLNCESSLRCADGYGRIDRKVYLHGEAYFEVIKNRQSFIVITPNASTKVLGTKFNIRARGEETRVVVKTGTVLLNKKEGENGSITLEKNDMGLISGEHTPQKIKSVETEKFLGWMNGRLIFNQQPLPEVMDELSRVYNVSIQISDSTLVDHTLTATFDNLPFTSIIHSICLTMSSEYRYENDEYIIY
ncbi:MAG: FecR domain-containing protein [bacterium]